MWGPGQVVEQRWSSAAGLAADDRFPPVPALSARGESRAEEKNGDCHQIRPRHDPRNKALNLKRIGWLYPIFRDVYFYHGLLCLGLEFGDDGSQCRV